MKNEIIKCDLCGKVLKSENGWKTFSISSLHIRVIDRADYPISSFRIDDICYDCNEKIVAYIDTLNILKNGWTK